MSTPLAPILKERIARDGPLTVEDFMAACLYDPTHGYYTVGRNFLPLLGEGSPEKYPHDFVTAAHLPCFAGVMAEWVRRQAPARGDFTFMECGAGSGVLMRDILAYMEEVWPEVFGRMRVVLVETSPALRGLQQRVLEDYPHCLWMEAPAETGLPIVLVGNELLDAFPHQQITNDGERRVGLDDGGELCFLGGEVVAERSAAMEDWLRALPQDLVAAVFLDYGASVNGVTGDTLQAVYRHEKVGVFEHIGDADLTVHVNFTSVLKALAESHPQLTALPLEDMGPFVMRHGLAGIALRHGAPDAATEAAVRRLVHPAEMGALFKVQAFVREGV